MCHGRSVLRVAAILVGFILLLCVDVDTIVHGSAAKVSLRDTVCCFFTNMKCITIEKTLKLVHM